MIIKLQSSLESFRALYQDKMGFVTSDQMFRKGKTRDSDDEALWTPELAREFDRYISDSIGDSATVAWLETGEGPAPFQ